MITDHQHLLWARIDAWNAAVPVGTRVTLSTEDGHAIATETAGEAFEESFRAIVKIKHASLPVPLHMLKITA